MGLLEVINTPRESLQIAKHKSVSYAERTPYWFLLCDLQIFLASAHLEQPHAQSLLLFLIVFGTDLIQFSMGRRTVQQYIRSRICLRFRGFNFRVALLIEVEQRKRMFWLRKVWCHCQFQHHIDDHSRKEEWRERISVNGHNVVHLTKV